MCKTQFSSALRHHSFHCAGARPWNHDTRAYLRGRLALWGLFLGVLTVCAPADAPSQSEWKTYSDTVHGYEFRYPADYEIEDHQAKWYLYLKHGEAQTEFYIEDWTRSVLGGMRWDLAKLASERALTACMADSCDCSNDCTVRTSEEVPNPNGVRVLALTRDEFDSCKPGVSRTLVPMYAVDLAGAGGSFLLLVEPHPSQKSGVAPDVLKSIVSTIKRTRP
jgi:hypothetical protein